MERRKHPEPPFTKPIPVVEEETVQQPEEDEEGESRKSRRSKKQKDKEGKGHRFDITKIITKFFSEENEIKE